MSKLLKSGNKFIGVNGKLIVLESDEEHFDNIYTLNNSPLIYQDKIVKSKPEPPFYISGYVGNGMIHTFDALENAGSGETRRTSGYDWTDLENKLTYSVGTSTYWSAWRANATNVWYNSDTWRNAAGTFTETNLIDISKPFTAEVRVKATRDSGSSGDSPGGYQQLGGSVLTLGVSSVAQNGGCDGTNGVLEFRIFANASTGENPGMQIFVGSTNGGYDYGYCAFRQYGYFQTDWHTYSVTHDGNGKLSYYADGNLVYSETIGKNFRSSVASWWKSNGSGINGANQRWFIGYDQRFAVYQKCLSPAEILSNYQNDLTRFAS